MHAKTYKLSSIQNKLAEKITKAVVAVEGCMNVNNNGSKKQKAQHLHNAPPAKSLATISH